MHEKRISPGNQHSISSEEGTPRILALILIAALLTLGGMVLPAGAQEAPATLTIAGFEFSGNETISSETLSGVLADVIGQDLTLLDLFEQVNRITRFYREQGFVVARALLPQQEVTSGIVRIEILEGRYGVVTLDNSSRLRDDVAQKHLASLRPSDLIRYSTLERPTLLFY